MTKSDFIFLSLLTMFVFVEIIRGTTTIAEKEKSGWIPVSERLPSECVEVLITATSPDGYIYTTTTWYQEKRWVMRHRADKVIAWQPLPEPFKESEKE